MDKDKQKKQHLKEERKQATVRLPKSKKNVTFSADVEVKEITIHSQSEDEAEAQMTEATTFQSLKDNTNYPP